jgi:hypothetical protein
MEKIDTNVAKYIELVYSERSELNHVDDLEERKKTACQKAKLNYEDPKTQEIIHLKNDKTNIAIFDYLRLHAPNDYILLIANQQLFWEQMQKMMQPLKGTDDDSCLKEVNLKNTISEKSEDLLQRIEHLKVKIFKEEAIQRLASDKIRTLRHEERLKKQA